ncbi:hypothetical protein [Halobacillus sp. BBL2006]|uniref:hypothetical protein n=1 Tax=Halobacillus sp. BBL2006 TaxID=1543706 RepID=UPI000542257A|nr:hypothetical protein [Halobacillus sp. BBL2006]KHE72393.1 hypothetical protein LD39_04735 [Halobacillus sp. BBL2006]
MGIAVLFLVLATVTPFLFMQMKKPALAAVQSVLLVGMWVYFFQVLYFTTPAAFSITWSTYYLSLVMAEVAWVMFVIAMVKSNPRLKDTLKESMK